MSNTILIIGGSGSGKSFSFRNLDPAETVIISVSDNIFSFPKGRSMYNEEKKNYKTSDNYQQIINWLQHINKNMEHIKTIIIDDSNFIMSHEFMERACEKKYEKFTEIGQKFWKIVSTANNLRSDLNVYFTIHSEVGPDGIIKAKTIGKMLDEKATLEGEFDLTLHAIMKDDQYKFLTNRWNNYLAKSPYQMFESLFIDNDLVLVNKQIEQYNKENG